MEAITLLFECCDSVRLVGIETVGVVHVGAGSGVGWVHVLKVMRKLVGPNTHCLLWVLGFFG